MKAVHDPYSDSDGFPSALGVNALSIVRDSDMKEFDGPDDSPTATEFSLVNRLVEQFPGMSRRKARKLLNDEMSEEEMETFLPMIHEMFPESKDPKRQDWPEFCDALGVGKYGLNDQERKRLRTAAFRIYPTTKERARAARNSTDEYKRNMENMVAQLQGPYQPNDSFMVATLYKRKAQKVRPVDANDGTGEGPGGHPDWYERSKTRDFPQPHVGKYAEYLLPRISKLPRGSRLTPERLRSLDVGDWLWPEERAMFDEMMINREEAIAFEWKEVRKIHPDVSPPIMIKTMPHQAWQEKNFPCPKALVPVVVKMLLERLERGVLEKCNGPYRNPWFLVAKKLAGTYRLINAAMKMNSVTLRDANLPPSVDEFSEEFAGCQIASLIDFFSGYDQLDLDPRCRDMTAFMTPLGLLRMTTPPQGATNSVAQFVRVVMTILEDLFPKIAMPFMDDIGVKGPYSDYDQAEILPGVRRFVFEHIQNLDKTLERIERAQATIGPKSQFCHNGMVVVGFVTGSKGRSPSSAAIVKVLKWERCNSVTEAKAFIGLCVYYRIWIKGFALIAEPIYALTKKGEEFRWEDPQKNAMQTLKDALTSVPILCKLHYNGEDGWGEIFLMTDASGKGWGGILGQVDPDGRRRVARYESGVWNKAERNYDAGKLECRAVLKCLQKLRFWLYGTHFILETDANTLVAQLNRAATDLPGALVTRWIAWIQLFDFEVRHIKGNKNTAADGLSRRPLQSDDSESDAEMDIDEWITAELDCMSIALVPEQKKKPRSQLALSKRGRNDLRAGNQPQQSEDQRKTGITTTRRLRLTASAIDQNNKGLKKQVLRDDGVDAESAARSLAEGSCLVNTEDASGIRARAKEARDLEGQLSLAEGSCLVNTEDASGIRARAKRAPANVEKPAFDPNEANSVDPLIDKYGDYYQNIARYLTTFQKPEGMNRKEFQALKKDAFKFSVRNRRLWRNQDKAYPPRMVIDDVETKDDIMKDLHDRTGHHGRENTYARIANRYYWSGCYDDVRKYVKSCRACQHKDKKRLEEALFPTKAAPLFHRVAIDCVAMPLKEGKNKLVICRDDFSGWAEATTMFNPKAQQIAKWFFNEVVCRHGITPQVKVDGGPEFRHQFNMALQKYGMHRIVISPYNAKGNGAIERGHKPFLQALIALTEGGKKSWVPFIPWLLFADRTTVHGPTGYTPFYMVYGREAVLPVETKYPTWRTLGWDEVHDRETLLKLRTQQFMMRDADVEEARLKKDRRRREGKEYFDDHHQIKPEPLKKGDMVLVYDIQPMDVDKSSKTKLMWRWLGPYKIREANALKGYYLLSELDNTPIERSYMGNRLKKFVKRNGYWYSAKDKVEPLPAIADEPELNARAEKEATERYYTRLRARKETVQTVDKNGAIVRVPELPESERSKYMRFPEDWDGEEEGEPDEGMENVSEGMDEEDSEEGGD